MAKRGPRTKQPAGGEELRDRLVEAAVGVLARDGFARTSSRAVAQEAGTVNGSIFYYFGSMDGLLAATARSLADRGIERLRTGLGGPDAHRQWPVRLGSVLRNEVEGEDGRAVMELLVGARTSPALAGSVQEAIDRAIEFATTELRLVFGRSPVAPLVPVPLVAGLAAAAFLGLEVLAQNGRPVDVEQLAPVLALAIQLITGRSPEQ